MFENFKKRGLLIFCFFLLFANIFLIRLDWQDSHRKLTFAMLDVGQGDALFIESPTGTQVVIDGGPNKALMKEIVKVMPWYDRHIDMLIVTNPDQDHFSGFIPLLSRYKTDVIISPGTISSNPAYEVLDNEITKRKIPKITALRGQKIDLGGGAYLEIFFRDRDISGVSINVGSIVMRLVYGETSILLQGDSISNIENYLLTLDKENLQSDILKVGHHGSKTSTTKEYVEVVSPQWAVISSGKDNQYGHPHKETLETLNSLKTKILDTCVMGQITFVSDGKEFILKNKNTTEVSVGCKSN